MFTLLASIASEVSLLQALKPGETVPKTWRPATQVTFEPCTTALPDSQKAVATLKSLLADARGELVKAKKLVRAKDWSGARAASGRLTDLAAQITRTSARDFPSGGGATWAPIRTIGWDLMRVSGFLEVKRLAAAKSTTKLMDSTISAIERVKLGGS